LAGTWFTGVVYPLSIAYRTANSIPDCARKKAFVEWIAKEIDFCFVGIRYEKAYPIVTIRSNATTRKRMETPFELRKEYFLKIPPNLPLLKGEATLPPLVKGDGGGLFVTASFFNFLLPPSNKNNVYR
jgi:hypothetical protein